MKRKVMTVVGTRPELIKMSAVIEKLDAAFDHILVHTGQNYDYELNQIFFEDLGVRQPDHFLNAAGANPAQTIAAVIAKSDQIFEREAPEALLIYGDTNSGLCIIPAKRRKIPVFHMEAGNRSFDQRVPEELNRKVIDHLSDVNLVLTEHSRAYLVAEGLRADRIFKTGSHLPEVLRRLNGKIEHSQIVRTLELEEDRYFLVSMHREENVDVPAKLDRMLETLEALANTYGYPVIVSTHPRTRVLLDRRGASVSPLIRFLKPFSFTDYVRLQLGAHCVISDSGTITEEAALLNLPAVTIRDAHERPEGQDAGAVVISRMDAKAVLNAIALMRLGFDRDGVRRFPVDDYRPENASDKVVRIVGSYIDVINATTWRKDTVRD